MTGQGPSPARILVFGVQMVRVSSVLPDSIAHELRVPPGTELLTVNGREVTDFLDWEFLTADDAFVVGARLPSGEMIEYDIERPEGVAMGIELERPTVRRCANKCEFCFVEGLPEGLRRNLYIRDDDYRLSFAYGNFATLSNLKERDYARILEYRLSPLYVSVHATPWEARRKLLNNPRVPDVLDQLSRLKAGGIRFHCQMVVVPGLNDGSVLEQTLQDLWDLDEAVLTVAIVPVGTTQFSHLYTGQPMDRARAHALLQQANAWRIRAISERGTGWVSGSDELYLLAGIELPGEAYYGDFSQVENGVGSVAHLRARITQGLGALARLDGRRIAVVTGTAMAQILPAELDRLREQTGAEFTLIPTVNSLFGPTVTTAGLLVGADIERALRDVRGFDLALIPAETLNDDGMFLDDRRLSDLTPLLPVPIIPSYDFVDALSAEHVPEAV
jgi:putative radical SAM enzyme (TIGR03279 family)